MDEFKTPVQGTTPAPTPVNTYEMPASQPVETAPVPAPEPVPEKKPSRVGKWLLWGLVVLLLAGLGAFAYWQYTDAQNAKNEVATLQTALKASQNANKTNETADESGLGDPLPDFDKLVSAYGAYVTYGKSYTDAEKNAIEKGIMDYYKLSTLPEGWAILSVVSADNADKTTGKPRNALIYWPKSSEKPAGFFEMKELTNGTWEYKTQS